MFLGGVFQPRDQPLLLVGQPRLAGIELAGEQEIDFGLLEPAKTQVAAHPVEQQLRILGQQLERAGGVGAGFFVALQLLEKTGPAVVVRPVGAGGGAWPHSRTPISRAIFRFSSFLASCSRSAAIPALQA